MNRYLDPKIDLVFRRIFGEHEHLCISLLNSMLPLEPDRQIVSLEYNSNTLLPDSPLFKESAVDVNCTDNFGRKFLVEMQLYWTKSFQQRVLFNASKAYVRQLDRGRKFHLLRPVYALSFVNTIFDKDSSIFYHDYKIVNLADTQKQIEGLELVSIELPKFHPSNDAGKKMQDLWLKFLTEIDDTSDNVPSEILQEELTQEALHYLEITSYSKEQLQAYDKYFDAISTVRTIHSDLFEEGMEKGIKKGIKKGVERGIKKGMENKEIEIVRNCKLKGFSLEQIQDITGLSKKRIKEIL
ncbi:MAG: Rpn family recombination-promoting nuclease/putative transposase [Planctomycetaceae bacterium]|nr:Rpn family recombination-promoting nuclease/putative transposase [Planctomycetaceae bacterium]